MISICALYFGYGCIPSKDCYGSYDSFMEKLIYVLYSAFYGPVHAMVLLQLSTGRSLGRERDMTADATYCLNSSMIRCY